MRHRVCITYYKVINNILLPSLIIIERTGPFANKSMQLCTFRVATTTRRNDRLSDIILLNRIRNRNIAYTIWRPSLVRSMLYSLCATVCCDLAIASGFITFHASQFHTGIPGRPIIRSLKLQSNILA